MRAAARVESRSKPTSEIPWADSDQLEAFVERAGDQILTEVDESSDSNFYWGLTNDISEGGLFVATVALMDPGSEITLAFTLPDGGDPIEVTGIVRWVRDFDGGRDAPPGYGVQFNDLPAAARDRISAFVRRRDPVFYDV